MSDGKLALKKLKILKTKAWANTCAYALSDSPGVPLKAYSLSKKANDFAAKNNKTRNHDQSGWKRRMDGKQSSNVSTINGLWSELGDSYHIGPWVAEADDVQFLDMDFGGFVPLWDAISGDIKSLIDHLFRFPFRVWEEWDPGFEKEKKYFRLKYNDSRSGLLNLYELACRLTQPQKYVPPLLSLTASITAARISGDSIIIMFEPPLEERSKEFFPPLPESGSQVRYSIHAEMRESIFADLSKINIFFKEVIEVAGACGVKIYDFAELNEQEYFDLCFQREPYWKLTLR